MAKITEKELELIKNQQEKLKSILNDIGLLEAQKHGLLHEIANINSEIEEHKVELEKKYGAIQVDIETGEYTEIEKPEEIKTETEK
jgi:vacuolar-type H+-ATPase subunit D/Vma8